MLANPASIGHCKRLTQVQRQLVATKTDVNPGIGATTFYAAQHVAIKSARLVQVAYVVSQVKQRLHCDAPRVSEAS
jgi:LDH2 family malate/lactate/ureidoglycolate dehydrogenase